MWSEIIALEVGRRLVGVGVDSARTARRVRAETAQWREVDGAGVRAVWNVRAERRRASLRRPGALHHGIRVVERFPSVDEAVEALVGVLAQIAEPPLPGAMQLEARLLMIHNAPVLYVPPAGSIRHDVARLAESGIRETPVHRVVVDASTGESVHGGVRHPLAAIVVTDVEDAPTIDAALRSVWGSADDATIEFAETLDQLRPIVHRLRMEASDTGLLALAEHLRR